MPLFSQQGYQSFRKTVQTEISLGRSTTAVLEGQTVVFTITAKNIRSGTRFSYEITGIDQDDLSQGLLSGEVTVSGYSAAFSITLRSDLSWQEGTETITVTVRRIREAQGLEYAALPPQTVTVIDSSTAPAGQRLITTETTFTVPSDITRISVLCIGAGGSGSTYSVWNSRQGQRYYYAGGGGGGGGLAYKNNITVTPGEVLYITRTVSTGSSSTNQGETSIRRANGTILCRALAGRNADGGTGGFGGSWTHGDQGFTGGPGGTSSDSTGGGCGGGGAAGYSGNGGRGSSNTAGSFGGSGVGGGAGGGRSGLGNYSTARPGGGGGGVDAYGQGTSGVGASSIGLGGGGGSGGASGLGGSLLRAGAGGGYGGGGGGGTGGGTTLQSKYSAQGAGGVVRIIYPGDRRRFPSTFTEDI